MTHVGKPDLADAVIGLIADTFDMPPGTITADTRPGEIPGWDSLGHSVLLTRLARRFRLNMTEDLAVPVSNVGELVTNLQQATERLRDA